MHRNLKLEPQTMTHCIIFASLMITWFLSPGLARAGEAEAQELIAIHGNLDEMCRGRSGNDPHTDEVCGVRGEVHKVLEEMGFCLGKKAQGRADHHWHHCTWNSQRHYTMEPSDEDPNTALALSTAKKVPSEIHYASSGGHWSQGENEGFFRVLIVSWGVEHVYYRLFTQWLMVDLETNGYELIRTVNVKELNEFRGRPWTLQTAFGETNSIKVAVTDPNDEAFSREITVSGDGTYDIR